MPYCSRCGVEVDINIETCPLCFTEIQVLEPEEKTFSKYPDKAAPHSVAPKRNKKEMRRMAAIYVTFGLLIPASIAFAADIVINGEVTWGTYTLSSLIYIWVLVLLPLLYYKKPILTLLAYYLSTLFFLYSIDSFYGGINWFQGLAFPITTITAALTVIILVLTRHSKIKGINILSYCVFALGIECIGIEMSVSLFLSGSISLGWSIIVLSAAIPAAGLLYYVHYKRKKPLKMKEYFHI
ncbi:MAG: DUF6320 domain-containing protein [Spirochaetaceae bacterium]|jgi:hypothetical protein|nr:DUF6320 domain-containing protein [Spirochaetaceae bacterium]